MPLYFHWYETNTSLAHTHTYWTLGGAEQERYVAQAWGWESTSPHSRVKRRGTTGSNGKKRPDTVEFVVAYTRTPSAAAAAEVKRHLAVASEAASGLARAQHQVTNALATLQTALAAARGTETNPIRLETQVRAAAQRLLAASITLGHLRQQVVNTHQAAHEAQQTITAMTPLIQQMGTPAADEIQVNLQQHMDEGMHEGERAATLAPALAAQEHVVTAVREWQGAIARRWRAQRAYLPVEQWWERLLVQVKSTQRRAPAVAVSREAVLTQVLSAAEVGPADEAWRKAEADVATMEAALLEAIAIRDQAMSAVGQAFGVTL